jgi:hypothetical protein
VPVGEEAVVLVVVVQLVVVAAVEAAAMAKRPDPNELDVPEWAEPAPDAMPMAAERREIHCTRKKKTQRPRRSFNKDSIALP